MSTPPNTTAQSNNDALTAQIKNIHHIYHIVVMYN